MKKMIERIYECIGNKILCIIGFVLIGLIFVFSLIPRVFSVVPRDGFSYSTNIFPSGYMFFSLMGIVFIIFVIILLVNYIVKITSKKYVKHDFISPFILIIIISFVGYICNSGKYGFVDKSLRKSSGISKYSSYVSHVYIDVNYWFILLLVIGLLFISMIFIFGENEKNYNSEVKHLKKVVNTKKNISEEDKLKKYKKLLDEGLITEEDYNIKKKEILNIK